MSEKPGFPTRSHVSREALPNAGMGGSRRASMTNSKSGAVACPRGAAEPHFTRIHKPLEPFEFREPYRIRRVQSSRDNWGIRRRISRLCRLDVRRSNEISLQPLGLIANKFAQRIYGFGHCGGARGIRTCGTAPTRIERRCGRIARDFPVIRLPSQMPSKPNLACVATQWRFLK
jgi:hypothetical protein